MKLSDAPHMPHSLFCHLHKHFQSCTVVANTPARLSNIQTEEDIPANAFAKPEAILKAITQMISNNLACGTLESLKDPPATYSFFFPETKKRT